MESQHPLIFLDPSPAFLMRITPAKPWSKSQRYTEDTPPSKYLKTHRYPRSQRATPTIYWKPMTLFVWYSQVSVLVKGVIGFNLEFPQASRWHGTIFNGGFILIAPRGSEVLKNITVMQLKIYLSNNKVVQHTPSAALTLVSPHTCTVAVGAVMPEFPPSLLWDQI